MRELYYEAIGEACFETKLPNGLMIRVIPKRFFARKYAFLGVNYGSMDIQFVRGEQCCGTPSGTAHFLEHKTFDMPYGSVMERFAQRGASANAFTGFNMTAYYMDCTEAFSENLETLLEFVSTACITPQSVERERGIITQEIQMYDDSADTRLYENLLSALYARHPIREPISGTVQSIQNITAQTLLNCHDAFYRPDNMMLCVVGDVDATEVEHIARQVLPEHSGAPVRFCRSAQEDQSVRVHRAEENMEVSLPGFLLGFRCAPEAHGTASMKQGFVGDLAAEMLMGESSELYQRLYEAGAIDADFSCGFENIPGAALLTAGGDCRDPDAVVAEILHSAEQMLDGRLDERLFHQLKRSMLGHRMRELDSFESIGYRQCAYYFDGCDYFLFPEIYEQITLQDVQVFLESAIQREQMAVSVVYPK